MVQRGRTVMPGVSIGTSRMDSPACRLDCGSVRHIRKIWVQAWAEVVKTFWPLMT